MTKGINQRPLVEDISVTVNEEQDKLIVNIIGVNGSFAVRREVIDEIIVNTLTDQTLQQTNPGVYAAIVIANAVEDWTTQCEREDTITIPFSIETRSHLVKELRRNFDLAFYPDLTEDESPTNLII